jgi:hypothetical protein
MEFLSYAPHMRMENMKVNTFVFVTLLVVVMC